MNRQTKRLGQAALLALMIAIGASLLCSCAAAPPETSPKYSRKYSVADVAAQFAAALRQPTLAATVDAAPLPAQVIAESQLQVTIAGHLGAMQTRDGSWLVQVPPTGARVTAYSTTQGAAGAMLNVRGTNLVDVHTHQVALPLAVVPGDALVVTSTAVPIGARDAYWPVPGRSAVDEAVAVVFVPYQVGPGMLRPPALGDGYLPRFLRTIPIYEAQVDVGKLPSVVDVDALGVDWSAWGAGKPDIAYLTALLRRFAGETRDGWDTDTRTPDMQHPGYGSYYASVISCACVQLCSTSTVDEKRPLALAVVQRGLDLVGAFADGRSLYPLGGHCAGRKALVVLAGHLLGVEPLADPSAIVGPRFQEDGCYFTASPAWWFGWPAGWRFRLDAPFDGTQLKNQPSTWGDAHAPQHDSWAWMVSYLGQVVPAQVGTALAMQLLHREREWSAAGVQMVAQWMQGPPAAARAQLETAGCVLPWGSDYSLVRGAGFSAAAWRRYAAR